MAVPSSGTLSMQDIAQERLNSTYGSGSVTGPISMYNLINGGNTGGAVNSGNNYPALNTGCDPHPPDEYVAVSSITSGSGTMKLFASDASTELTGYVKKGTTETDLLTGSQWVLYSNTSGTYYANGTYVFGEACTGGGCACGYQFSIVNGRNTGGNPEAIC